MDLCRPVRGRRCPRHHGEAGRPTPSASNRSIAACGSSFFSTTRRRHGRPRSSSARCRVLPPSSRCWRLVSSLQRRREIKQRLANQAALQAANDMLETRVQERTAELRAAQDELVHAGKLAALGQMSAGIVHELNQPSGCAADRGRQCGPARRPRVDRRCPRKSHPNWRIDTPAWTPDRPAAGFRLQIKQPA